MTHPAVDTTTLPGPAQKILDGSAPMPIRQMAARGIAPGLRPGDALTVLVLLAESSDATVAQLALTTLDKLPAPVLNGALTGQVHPGVLDAIAPRYATDAEVMGKILMQPGILGETVARVAELANEAVSELVAVNEERLLQNPAIIEKLYMNKATRMSTADRVLELAVRNKIELPGIPAFKEAAEAIQGELIAEPSAEPTPDDELFKEVDAIAEATPLDTAHAEDTHKLDEETGEEILEDKFLPLHAKLAAMSISQRIRRAMLGSAGERNLLVRDKNKLVASAAVRSPKIQESDIVMIAASRNVSDEVLRIIATNRVWTENYQVKLNLVTNPRTPFVFASRLLGFVREAEMKKLAKSKSVSAAIANLARRRWRSGRSSVARSLSWKLRFRTGSSSATSALASAIDAASTLASRPASAGGTREAAAGRA